MSMSRSIGKINVPNFVSLNSEVVLLLLIESFKFSPSPGKEIYWQTQTIAKPATVGSSDTQLPLVVERAV
jgi:hypothetical protein